MSSDSAPEPSNFELLEDLFRDIILSVRPYDRTGRETTLLCARKTYVLCNDTHLSVTEHYTRNHRLDHYYYDWYRPEGAAKTEILKFHSEPHDDQRYTTKTEPYHVHVPEEDDQSPFVRVGNFFRLENWEHRSLFRILEFIRLFIRAHEVLRK